MPQLYWNLPSPGTVQRRRNAAVFSSLCARLEEAMQARIDLPLEELEGEQALARLREIGPR